MHLYTHRFAALGRLLATGVFAVSAGCTSKTAEPANTVHLAVPAKIKGLDPIYSDDIYASGEAGKAYEGLLQYHYLKRPFTLIPNLAEEMPTISTDGKTYTFKIKQGVHFQDDPCFAASSGKGRELTAEDFIYAWKRVADPKTVSPGFWIFDGKVLGVNAWRDEASKAGKTDYSKPIAGLRAPSPYVLKIELIAPNYQFLYLLAMTMAYVVPHEAVEHYGSALLNHAVGTGPFRLVSFNGASRIIWDRNPTYRHEVYPTEGEPTDKENGFLGDAGQPLPRADRIVTQVFEETQPAWLNFVAGKLDAAAIPKDNYSSAVTSDKKLQPDLVSKGIRLYRVPRLDVTHLTFNMADPLIGKNKLLRQALSLSYNETPSLDLFYNGRAIAAQGPIPPTLAGYDPNFRNPYRQFDLAKAKDLLSKAGYPNGEGLPPLEYVATSDSTQRQMTEYMQTQFAAIGVKVKVNTYSWPEFTASIKNKRGQMWGWGWSGDYPDAENFLQQFYSKSASPGPNDANYSNPEYDRLYEKSLTLADGPARTEIYKNMVKIVTEDCPWIFDVHREAWALTQPWTKGYKYNEVEYSRYKYYRVDTALRK